MFIYTFWVSLQSAPKISFVFFAFVTPDEE